MSDKLFGLAGLGLDNLEDMEIFGQEKKEEKSAAEAPKIEEKDLIYDKNVTCPVCGEVLGKNEEICETCRKKLLYVQEPKCKKCGKSYKDNYIGKKTLG